MNMTMRFLACFIISVVLFVLASAADARPGEGITAITAPSADIYLSFIQPGKIVNVFVREGDMVQAGQALVQQDNAAELTLLSLLREQSRDISRIETRKAVLAQKKIYLKRLEWAAERSSATELEVEDAKLEVRIARSSLKEAELEQKLKKRKYKEAKIRIASMRLRSPIAGSVEEIGVEVGESVDALSDVVRVVGTDPLRIDVHVPLDKGRAISLDQAATIIFPGSEQGSSKGKIIFISTVADAASSTLKVRIEVPNKSNRPAGERVTVLFPEL